MNPYELIEKHFVVNRTKYIKWLSHRSGSEANAEDIHQEAYFRALKYHKSCREEELGHWVGRIIHRCLIDFMNDMNGRSIDDAADENDELVECTSFPAYMMEEIFELISTKSEVQIEVLTMHLRHEYSAIDISKITDYSYARCHQIISRFRKELKTLYA